jgi:hypothetical protein
VFDWWLLFFEPNSAPPCYPQKACLHFWYKDNLALVLVPWSQGGCGWPWWMDGVPSALIVPGETVHSSLLVSSRALPLPNLSPLNATSGSSCCPCHLVVSELLWQKRLLWDFILKFWCISFLPGELENMQIPAVCLRHQTSWPRLSGHRARSLCFWHRGPCLALWDTLPWRLKEVWRIVAHSMETTDSLTNPFPQFPHM